MVENGIQEPLGGSKERIERRPGKGELIDHSVVCRLPTGRGSWQGSRKRVRSAIVESRLESCMQIARVQAAHRGKQRDVWEILDAGVWAVARQRIRVQLFGDMRDHRVHSDSRRLDARESQDISRLDEVRRANNRIAMRDIDSERIAIDFVGESAGHPESTTFVDQPRPVEDGMSGIVPHLELHEVGEAESGGGSKTLEHAIRRSAHPKIDVLGCPHDVESHFENKTTLEDDRISSNLDYARQEPVEDDELPASTKLEVVCAACLESRFQRLPQ